MHVEVRKTDDVILVDLSGRLIAGVGDVILREVINELLAEGWKKILLNMEEIRIIDSCGIGELVASWKIAGRFGAKLWVLRPGDRVRHTLQLSQLLPLLTVWEDEREALEAFRNADLLDEPAVEA